MFKISEDVLELMSGIVDREYEALYDSESAFGGCMDCSNSCAENCAYKCKASHR